MSGGRHDKHRTLRRASLRRMAVGWLGKLREARLRAFDHLICRGWEGIINGRRPSVGHEDRLSWPSSEANPGNASA